MIVNARNPKWADADHEMIMLEVCLDNGEWADFAASPKDCVEYGPMLYSFAINNIFGPVADSDEERILAGELPVPEGYIIQNGQLIDMAAYERSATAELNRRLTEFTNEEARALAEIDEEYAAERKAKIAALLAVKKQDGWPINVAWPE